MSDNISELVWRLRVPGRKYATEANFSMDVRVNSDCADAANALEAQAKEIERLKGDHQHERALHLLLREALERIFLDNYREGETPKSVARKALEEK